MDADGVVATCRDRIGFLQESQRLSETEACSIVSGVQFPGLCGPECNPALCHADRTPPLPPPPTQPNVFSEATATTGNPFGENVILFDPSMSRATIQGIFDDLFLQQVNNEMGPERYGLYFLPGVYGSAEDPLELQIGYYMQVHGLGASPRDVVIYGKIEVYNRCFEKDPYQDGKFIPTTGDVGLCFALNNFWRSLSNLMIQVVHKPGTDSCRSTAMFWAISQASSMRRVEIRGADVSLMDYCSSM